VGCYATSAAAWAALSSWWPCAITDPARLSGSWRQCGTSRRGIGRVFARHRAVFFIGPSRCSRTRREPVSICPLQDSHVERALQRSRTHVTCLWRPLRACGGRAPGCRVGAFSANTCACPRFHLSGGCGTCLAARVKEWNAVACGGRDVSPMVAWSTWCAAEFYKDEARSGRVPDDCTSMTRTLILLFASPRRCTSTGNAMHLTTLTTHPEGAGETAGPFSLSAELAIVIVTHRWKKKKKKKLFPPDALSC